MALYVMCLMGQIHYSAIGRVGPGKSRHFWAQTALVSLELFQGPKESIMLQSMQSVLHGIWLVQVGKVFSSAAE